VPSRLMRDVIARFSPDSRVSTGTCKRRLRRDRHTPSASFVRQSLEILLQIARQPGA
jgi:hypothetical protein